MSLLHPVKGQECPAILAVRYPVKVQEHFGIGHLGVWGLVTFTQGQWAGSLEAVREPTQTTADF